MNKLPLNNNYGHLSEDIYESIYDSGWRSLRNELNKKRPSTTSERCVTPFSQFSSNANSPTPLSQHTSTFTLQEQEHERLVLIRNSRHLSDFVVGRRSVGSCTVDPAGFGFTLRHFIIYPPDEYEESETVSTPIDTIFVKSVRGGSAAHIAGLRLGDRISSVNGIKVEHYYLNSNKNGSKKVNSSNSYSVYSKIVSNIRHCFVSGVDLVLGVTVKDFDVLQRHFSEIALNPESNQRVRSSSIIHSSSASSTPSPRHHLPFSNSSQGGHNLFDCYSLNSYQYPYKNDILYRSLPPLGNDECNNFQQQHVYEIPDVLRNGANNSHYHCSPRGSPASTGEIGRGGSSHTTNKPSPAHSSVSSAYDLSVASDNGGVVFLRNKKCNDHFYNPKRRTSNDVSTNKNARPRTQHNVSISSGCLGHGRIYRSEPRLRSSPAFTAALSPFDPHVVSIHSNHDSTSKIHKKSISKAYKANNNNIGATSADSVFLNDGCYDLKTRELLRLGSSASPSAKGLRRISYMNATKEGVSEERRYPSSHENQEKEKECRISEMNGKNRNKKTFQNKPKSLFCDVKQNCNTTEFETTLTNRRLRKFSDTEIKEKEETAPEKDVKEGWLNFKMLTISEPHEEASCDNNILAGEQATWRRVYVVLTTRAIYLYRDKNSSICSPDTCEEHPIQLISNTVDIASAKLNLSTPNFSEKLENVFIVKRDEKVVAFQSKNEFSKKLPNAFNKNDMASSFEGGGVPSKAIFYLFQVDTPMALIDWVRVIKVLKVRSLHACGSTTTTTEQHFEVGKGKHFEPKKASIDFEIDDLMVKERSESDETTTNTKQRSKRKRGLFVNNKRSQPGQPSNSNLTPMAPSTTTIASTSSAANWFTKHIFNNLTANIHNSSNSEQPLNKPIARVIQPSSTVKPSFDTPLSQCLYYEEPEIDPPFETREPFNVPLVVRVCIEIVRVRGGLNAVGIYRVPGNSAAISNLIQNINSEGVSAFQDILTYLRQNQADSRPKSFEMLEEKLLKSRWLDVNVQASILKAFLRRLPNPLLSSEIYPILMNIEQPLNCAQLRTIFSSIEGEEEKKAFSVLKYILEHLREVSDNSFVNKMDVTNLAIVFGPTLLRKCEDEKGADNEISMMRDMPKQCKILEFLIQNFTEIFVVRQNDEKGAKGQFSDKQTHGSLASDITTQLPNVLPGLSLASPSTDSSDKDREQHGAVISAVIEAALRKREKKIFLERQKLLQFRNQCINSPSPPPPSIDAPRQSLISTTTSYRMKNDTSDQQFSNQNISPSNHCHPHTSAIASKDINRNTQNRKSSFPSATNPHIVKSKQRGVGDGNILPPWRRATTTAVFETRNNNDCCLMKDSNSSSPNLPLLSSAYG